MIIPRSIVRWIPYRIFHMNVSIVNKYIAKASLEKEKESKIMTIIFCRMYTNPIPLSSSCCLPEVLVGVPACLTELPCPTYLLTIQSEILCYPEDRIRHTTILSCTKLLIDCSRVATESDTTLKPRTTPQEPFIVIDILTSQCTVGINWTTCRGREG